MSDKNYKFLPSDDKLLKLETCDFYLQGEQNSSNVYRVQCGLKKIFNPILILFYYNITDNRILTEFYKSSRAENLKKGKIEDNYRKEKLTEKDLIFKFGSVNLDYENSLFESFGNIENGNPFKWMEIVKKEDKEIQKYPFIVFYYQSLPQYIYEGRLSSQTISSEFNNWYKDLMEREEENRENKNFQDGIYMAIANGEKEYYSDIFNNEIGKFIYQKGEIFKVFIQNSFVIFSRDSEAESFNIPKEGEIEKIENIEKLLYPVGFIGPKPKSLNIENRYELNMDYFYSNFRKLDVLEENKIDKEKMKMYQEMYKISHPGIKNKSKKEIYLDTEFFTTGFGEEGENLEIFNSLLKGAGLDRDEVMENKIRTEMEEENQRRRKFSESMRRKRDLEISLKSMKQVLKELKIRNGKIKNTRELNALNSS